jgi:large subunit ribosomal protein L32e
MTTEIKRLIQVRVDKGAVFKRDGYGKKRQLSDSWRKPRGQHNKQREQKKAKGALPKPGFGSPVAVRGMHPSGFFEILISSVKELEGIDPKTHAIRIGATVGNRARVGLQEKALSAGFKLLNSRTVRTEPKQKKIKEPVKESAKGTEKNKKEEKKPAKSKITAAPLRKDTKKEKKKPETEEKKAPVKEKKSVKQKVEPEEKMERTKPAVHAKTTKKTAKPKTEEPAEAEAQPKAAAKPKAKKKTEPGVKKNE